MVKGLLQGAPNLPADLAQVIDQLERHCLAPDGSLVPKPAYYDLQLAREEMSRERLRYLESMAIYCEATAMVEEYQQAISMANLRDAPGLYTQLGLNNSPQVYKTLEHRMVIAEAAQKLRLPLNSKDGEIHEDDIERLSIMSRSSLDSTSTSVTISSSSNSTYNTVGAGDLVETGVGGVPNRFLGITPAYLRQTQLQQIPLSMDMAEYQMSLSCEIEARLKAKCDKLADAFIMDDLGSKLLIQDFRFSDALQNGGLISTHPPGIKLQILGCQKGLSFSLTEVLYSISLPANEELMLKDPTNGFCPREMYFTAGWRRPKVYYAYATLQIIRVKLIIEEIEREEAALREDLYSADRKFAEYYNVLEQILGVLIKLVKDLKLQHQHKYDDLQKTWLCKRCETMSAKLRVLENVLLLETYTQESIPALHKIRKYLLEATEEASIAYNKAVTRLREYQGVDPHFDTIARQYHDIVKKLENMQWTIHQVEMDLKRLPEHPST
ncbi:hypothetical protein CJ030_MR4G025835 [Morella rubra]|uniref:AUGMIN subunit 4 n=1 Tax=Morella rubra TaxID=262757 RepID=A0A6A1VTC9_9ROSI|nr:hypothetical protein CJ030_MR4G025835 [Morella rubra]